MTSCDKARIELPDNGEIVEIVDEDAIYWKVRENQWIFSTMKHNYLWADELKDSLEYDYSLEPEKFFLSMKVPQDRFSYLEPYSGYVPPTKTQGNSKSVFLDTVYTVSGKNIGYIKYDGFETKADVTDAAYHLLDKKIEELIIDLRDNPGGYVNTGVYFASLILPLKYMGELFALEEYNREISERKIREHGSPRDTIYFNDDAVCISRNLKIERVFFLIGKHSASCSELMINSLRPYMPVITIGQTTTGKDVGMHSFAGQHFKNQLWPITFRTYNRDNIPVPVTGIVPDIYVEDSPVGVIGDVEEPLLKKAIDCIIRN